MVNKNKKKQNGVVDESPLKLFGEAKDTINGIFEKLDRCISDACKTYPKVSEIECKLDRFNLLSKNIAAIRGVLARNQMKVAFFGHTSNGKSTTINAILNHEVLPAGIGTTTTCFLQIQGNQDDEAFLEKHNTKVPIDSVRQIAEMLDDKSLEPSTLVKIYWPTSKCPLLKHDVALVDSPGVDADVNIDKWIDEHCHDADVFVLVSNANSTLNVSEKNFFHKVSENLSKPNIFILNNHWDITDKCVESLDKHRKNFIDKAVKFLRDELEISSEDEVLKRTFFVSADETLKTRTSNGPITKTPGYYDRYEEFKNFERCFEESLSKSAVKTKFKTHADKGRETREELSSILKDIQSQVDKVSEQKRLELNQSLERFGVFENLFYKNEQGLRREILEIKQRIKIVADTEFENEIRRLSRSVEEFELEFSLNPEAIRIYKEQLYKHVEEMLSQNLESRINSVINKHVNPFNKAMELISQRLSQCRHQKIKDIINSQSYVQDDTFDLRTYRQFYSGFQEDLEFRFSLGLVNIIRKFQGNKYVPSNSSSNSINTKAAFPEDTYILSFLERFIMNPPQSPTTVGSLAIGGVLVRTVGWRVIVITTVVYGALYAYEYLTWTKSAKERSFKAQYVKYAKKGLQQCVPIISRLIANSVEQKMTDTFSKVKLEVDTECSEIRENQGILEGSLKRLEYCETITKELLSRSDVLMTELTNFMISYL